MCPCKFFFGIGAALAFLAVAAGAFGSHFLKQRWSEDQLAIFEVAVRYQMYHALALLAVAWASTFFDSSLVVLGGGALIGGTLIFSGSLYALLLTGVRWWGAVTPIGGTFLLIGWLLLFIGVWLSRPLS